MGLEIGFKQILSFILFEAFQHPWTSQKQLDCHHFTVSPFIVMFQTPEPRKPEIYTPEKLRGWQATRVQFFIDLWNWNITSYHKCSSLYKDMKFDYIL